MPYTTADGGDMESNAWHFGGRIVSGGKQLWERGAPSNHFTTSYYNGSNAWVTDLDADMTDTDIECELLTPSFNFSAAGTYTLSFVKSMEYQFSNAPFAARVEYSLNKGKTWTRLGSNATGTGWYNRGPSPASGISYLIFPDSMGWTNNYTKSAASHDVSSLAGNESVCFRVLWKVSNAYGSGYSRAGFLVDDFAIAGPSNDSITGGGIESEIASKTVSIGAYDSLHFYSSNGKIIASIWNLSNHDFGETTVEIDATGSSAVNFDVNTDADKRVFSKSLKITPTTNNTGSSVKIATYYSAAELAGWKAVTGLDAKHIQHLKTTNAIASSTIAQGVHPSVVVVDSTFDGSNLCITGTFSNGFSGVGSGGGGSGGGGDPLPVRLLSFHGKRSAFDVKLNWITASEIDNDYFEIYRSENGEDFIPIAQVDGFGNSNNLLDYQYIDTDPKVRSARTFYYQIKQVDYSKLYQYSKIIRLAADELAISAIIGPNPVAEMVKIQINPFDFRRFTLEVLDLNGRIMLVDKNLQATNEIDISNLPGGVYLFAIKRDDDLIVIKRMIKN